MTNPNPRTDQLEKFKWKKGQSGNPAGTSKEVQQSIQVAAVKAARIQEAMLTALAQRVEEDPDEALAAIKADPLRLIKDAMDRALGQPEQKISVEDNTDADDFARRMAGLAAKSDAGGTGEADT